MLTIYDARGDRLARQSGAAAVGEATVWIDLMSPTSEEDRFVEDALGLNIPTRAEMREIEASNRLYQENGACFMTGVIVHNIEAPLPEYSAVTFILAGRRLITVRYVDFKAMPLFLARVEKGDTPARTGAEVLVGLLEALISRKADLVERIQDDTDKLASAIFDIKGGQQTRSRRLDVLLKAVGTDGDITARAQESASSLERLLHYLATNVRERGDEQKLLKRIEGVQADVKSLTEHMRFLNSRTAFLLDATLGQITIEQNQIIKLFSVVAVILLPPTLIASAYGMNFRHMPELDWVWGYPAALALMALSALVPYLYFRRKGWL